jgi:hypothetical protein
MAYFLQLAYLLLLVALSSTTAQATYIIPSDNVQNPAVEYIHSSLPPGVPHPWFYYLPEAGLIDGQRLYGGNR